MDSWYNGKSKTPTFNSFVGAIQELETVLKYYALGGNTQDEHVKMYDLAADLEDISNRLREIAKQIAPIS